MIRIALITLSSLSLLAAVIPIPTGPESAFTKTLKPLTNAPLWREALGISNVVGGSIYATNIIINGTNAPQGNGTPPYLPVWATTNVLGDSPVYQIDTNKVGVDEVWANSLLVTNLQTGGVVLSTPSSGYATNLLRGVGFVHDDGTNITLQDVSATTVITNLFVTNLIVLNFITVGGTNVAVVNPTDLYLPVRASTNAFADSPLHIPSAGSTNLIVDGQIFFTAGNSVSNSLVREDDTLIYTNDSISATVGPGFMVRDRNGRFASLRALGTTAEVAGSNSVSLNATFTQVQLNGSLVVPSFGPLNDGVSLGSATASTTRPWGDIIGRGVIYNYGFPLTGADIADLGNYARLSITHTGTNGAIVFDSQSAGSAGDPVDYAFRIGNTNNFQVKKQNMVFSDRMELNLSTLSGDTAFTALLRNAAYDPIDIVVNSTLLAVSDGTIGFQPGGTLTSQALVSARPVIARNVGTASLGTQQWSPSISWAGAGWSTGASASKLVRFDSMIEPIQGAEPVGMLRFYGNTNGVTQEVFGISTEGPVKLGRVTKAQRDALLNVEDGMIVYQTDNTPGVRWRDNGAWVKPTTSADP
jgi:hypothetical protein